MRLSDTVCIAVGLAREGGRRLARSEAVPLGDRVAGPSTERTDVGERVWTANPLGPSLRRSADTAGDSSEGRSFTHRSPGLRRCPGAFE
jgi:hypothetical protein